MKELVVYTDGSYVRGNNYCGYAAVILEPGEEPSVIFGSISDPKYVSSWNVGGELRAVEVAINFAMEHQYDIIHIHHDYIGISQWASGAWKRNKPLTQDYYKYIKLCGDHLQIKFTHVKGHSGNYYNEMADSYASKCPHNVTVESCHG